MANISSEQASAMAQGLSIGQNTVTNNNIPHNDTIRDPQASTNHTVDDENSHSSGSSGNPSSNPEEHHTTPSDPNPNPDNTQPPPPPAFQPNPIPPIPSLNHLPQSSASMPPPFSLDAFASSLRGADDTLASISQGARDSSGFRMHSNVKPRALGPIVKDHHPNLTSVGKSFQYPIALATALCL